MLQQEIPYPCTCGTQWVLKGEGNEIGMGLYELDTVEFGVGRKRE